MKRDFYGDLERELAGFHEQGTYKTLKYNTGALTGKMQVEDYGDVIMLCSNNYLGLADHPRIVAAAKSALDKYGAGASSVRFICGTYDIHRELETTVARFLGTESALTYTSCWAANTALIPTILKDGDMVISDALNHASIIDGCRMVGKGVKKGVYQHSDMASLEQQLIAAKDCGKAMIVTDGVFSMEGDIAKLPEIVALAKKYNALLVVDDSHATGVIGPTGRGTMEHFGITSGVDIITGTFGKALGGAGGGFVAASKDICDLLVQKSRPHLFSNCLPPVLCAIAMEAIRHLDEHPEIVDSLRRKTNFCRAEINKMGLKTLDGESAIIPLLVGDTAKSITLSEQMLKKGVYAIGFGFPVVPEGAARIRLQISDSLSDDEIKQALGGIREVFL